MEKFSIKRKAVLLLYIFIIFFTIGPCFGQIVIPLTIIGLLLLITWEFPHKILNVISFLLSYLLVVCSNYIFTLIAKSCFHLTVNDLNERYMIPSSLSYVISTFFLTKFLRYLLYEKFKIQNLKVSKTLVLCLLANLAVCTAIFILGIIGGERVGYPPSIVLFNNILFLSYFLLSNAIFLYTYRIIHKDEQLKTQLSQFENLQSYTQELENLYRDMRAFKHDYINILTSMKLYIDKEDLESLQTYFYNEIIPISQTFADSNNTLGSLSNLKSEELKSLVSSKLLYAMEKGLHVEIEIIKPVSAFSMKLVDLIRIMGIFLDNAIEASVDSDKKLISLAIIQEKNYVAIIVANSSDPLPYPISALCKQNVSGKGTNRGIGLYNAKKIIDSYPSVTWEMTYQNYCFAQMLTIYESGS